MALGDKLSDYGLAAFKYMTPEERSDLEKAKERGEKIEYFHLLSSTWRDTTSSDPFYGPLAYRVKPRETQIKENQMDSKRWRFFTTHRRDIDFREIEDSLTRKNPVAIVSVSDTENYVVLHASLIEKYYSLEERVRPEYPRKPEWEPEYLEFLNENVEFVREKSNLSKWVTWTKKVKEAPWPKNAAYRKAVVTVSLPKI